MRTQLLALLALGASMTAALADQIVMKNGDRVTGSIIKKDAANVTVKSVHFGTVTLPWADIDTIKTDAPLTVVLPNNKSVEGTLTSSGDKIVVDEKGTQETVPPKDIVALRNADEQKAYLRYLKPKLSELWVITGNIGIAGTAGNAETRTFTIPVTFVRATNNDKTTAYFNFIDSSASLLGVTAQTARAVRGGWAYNRNLRPKLFVTLFNDYEYDKFQNLDLRFVIGGGFGYHAWKKERGFFDVVGGADYNHTAFGAIAPATSGVSTGIAEAFFGDDAGFKLTKKFALTQTYRVFLNLADTGNDRQNFDLGLSASLAKYFTWNAALSDRYVSNPSPGRKTNDFIYSTGFGFSFTK